MSAGVCYPPLHRAVGSIGVDVDVPVYTQEKFECRSQVPGIEERFDCIFWIPGSALRPRNDGLKIVANPVGS